MGGSSPLTISNISIPQLDGNISILSQSEYSFDQSELSECKNFSPTEYEGEPIPVYISEYKNPSLVTNLPPLLGMKDIYQEKLTRWGQKITEKLSEGTKELCWGNFYQLLESQMFDL